METKPSPEVQTQPLRITLDSGALLGQLTAEVAKSKPDWQQAEFFLVALLVVTCIVLGATGRMSPEFSTFAAGLIGAGFHFLNNGRKNDREDALYNLAQLAAGAAGISTTTAATQALSVAHPQTSDPSAAPAGVSGGAAGGAGAGPKTATLIALSTGMVLLLAGCASTVVKDAAGHTRMRTMADAASLSYHDEHASLVIVGMNHSTPTLAGGHATARIIKAGGDAVTSTALAVGSGGASTALPSVAGKAGAIAVPLFSNPLANPPITPAPAAATH